MENQKNQFNKQDIIIIDIAGKPYAVLLNEIKEIIKIDSINPIPGSKNFIAGLMPYRGTFITVIDLEKILPDKNFINKEKHSFIISFEYNQHLIGFKIKKNPKIQSINIEDIIPNKNKENIQKKELSKNIVKLKKNEIPLLEIKVIKDFMLT